MLVGLSILISATLLSCDTQQSKTTAQVAAEKEKATKDPVDEKKPEPPPPPTETTPAETDNKAEVEPVEAGQNPVLCGGKELAPQLAGIVQKHTGVPYSKADRTTQCSGIFQRVLGSVREICPDAVSKTPPADQMDSRRQAKWYYEKEALTLIKDPIAQAELIRPGAVMFYGKKSQEYYNSNPVKMLWNDTLGIRHVGVVVEVKRNEAGEIDSYSLFHGRIPGTLSGISNADNYMHRRIAKSNAPSFGNGPDPWVGVAAMVLQE